MEFCLHMVLIKEEKIYLGLENLKMSYQKNLIANTFNV